MKCEKIKNLILLKYSGELSPAKQRRLQAHLSACPECRRYEEEVCSITDLALKNLPTRETASSVVDEITSLASAQTRPDSKRFHFSAPQILAWAALAIALLGATLLLQHRSPKLHNNTKPHLACILAIIDEEASYEINNSETMSRDQLELELGRHLLRIEGLLDEDLLESALL